MKARVKTTGEIMTVERNIGYPGGYVASDGCVYLDDELVLVVEESPDYWTRLEHQYAGMAMQGILSDNVAMEQIVYNQEGMIAKIVANFAVTCAHALVEKLKEEEK